MKIKTKLCLAAACVLAMLCAMCLCGCGKKMQVQVEIHAEEADTAVQLENPILFSGYVEVKENATVYDVLKATDVDFEGDESHVSSIGGVDEGAVNGSGQWIFGINTVPVSADEQYGYDYQLVEGDAVIWFYLVD